MKTKKHCLALDLKDDPSLIEVYKQYHAPGGVWPEVLDSLRDSGIQHMEIYLVGNRLFMIIEVDEHFSFERKAQMDAANPHVQRWEELMWQYQQPLPWAEPGQKWVQMERVFKFEA
ncbi:MAG: L-rhamnose mutarotase [Bacteroidetes bacterium]|nr:MAG: L-rhamnose mutarotase [Bacteroidota bacterium]